MQERDKAYAKPAHEDVGNEHGAIVKTRLRFKVLLALRTGLSHLKGLPKRKSPLFKQILILALRTFYQKYTMRFRSFFQHR